MEYLTSHQIAMLWNISPRLVQKLCAQGRILGAKKHGNSWMIPSDAQKPQDPRRQKDVMPISRQDSAFFSTSASSLSSCSGLMPLMNTPFLPGHCMEKIEQMAEGPEKEMARAEYYYFSGQAELALKTAGPFLDSEDLALRLSANLICGYANLTIGEIEQAHSALHALQNLVFSIKDPSSPLFAAAVCINTAAATLLHLPLPEGLPSAQKYLALLPDGLRAFGMYVSAHSAYLHGEYERSLGIVEATLSMQGEIYPIASIYLHLVAVMDQMSLRRPDQAQIHLLKAWDLARPDDLIEGFGEHHGLLGGMLEAVIKKDWPEDFKRIIAITYRFSAGWRRVHNPVTGHDVADNLTTTEFAVAMLAARGWTNLEIAEQMNISPNTVKRYISTALEKLNIRHRQDLKKYMLQ